MCAPTVWKMLDYCLQEASPGKGLDEACQIVCNMTTYMRNISKHFHSCVLTFHLCIPLSTFLRLCFCSAAMAFVGPVQNPHGYRPVRVFCEHCSRNLLVWRCYNCGGQYCGRCVFLHRNVPGVAVEAMDADRVSANELAEGMHIIFVLC